MRILAALAIVALASCATPLPQVIETGGGTFDVRYDQHAQSETEADAKAAEHCGAPASFISAETRYDGFAYRTYRCEAS